MESPSLIAWMGMSAADWATFSRDSPVSRTGRQGFLRNVAVALGNRRLPDAVPALIGALADSEPLVRGHAAWALGRIGTEASREALAARQSVETDDWVRSELSAARNSADG